ncbi:unnamed protein product [Zymoseptoria tritici ST99CH_3D7]|uniref:Uncharacterized protein n=1 Tax=Zymoseptoria tritici (strain ST99CH_3D7) TaxID=1276538 RepID=A0A1X7RCH4_ZYMT9|nr:unnamed protein product [Zymoseptoria tritici ST99CH_3D7]
MHDRKLDEDQGDEHDKEHDADHNVFAHDHNIFAHGYYNDTHHANVNHYLSPYHHRVPDYDYNILHYHGHNDLNKYYSNRPPDIHSKRPCTILRRPSCDFCGCVRHANSIAELSCVQQ